MYWCSQAPLTAERSCRSRSVCFRRLLFQVMTLFYTERTNYVCTYTTIYIYIYIYVQVWFLLSHQEDRGIRLTTKIPRSPKDNGCMRHNISDKNASTVELRNATDAKTTLFVRSMNFDPNEPSVNGIMTGNEASQKDI